jgi:hypothetical protein
MGASASRYMEITWRLGGDPWGRRAGYSVTNAATSSQNTRQAGSSPVSR